MDKENKSLEQLLRADVEAKVGKKDQSPELVMKVRHLHTVGVHVLVEPLGISGDSLDFTVVDNKLIPHFVTPNGNGMSFGDALEQMQMGDGVARSGWNGKDLWLELQTPDENSKMTLPYIYINYPDDAQNTPGARVPWLASQTDLLTQDWVIVKPAEPQKTSGSKAK